jgi:eukaryotic-like serine/threonine-protein kinase
VLTMPLKNGTRLGPFELVAPIGAGGMGEVYRAVQSGLDRDVAIKVLHWKAGADTERLRRFEQEARAASSLNHPSIISIYDIGSVDGVSYIAMEFVDGRTIRALLQAGPVAIKKTLQIAAQIADGLAKAHPAGIVHRDIKPENIMVNRDGHPKILDFGLAKLAPVPTSVASTVSGMAAGAAPVTDPGTLLGTVAYMSPEQARGMEVDYRSDIFSFGSVLYEMLTGKQPFRKESPAQTLAAIIEDEPEPVSDLNPRIPGPLRWVVERCLAKDPQDRYASTLDLARDLENVRDHLLDSGMAAERTPTKPTVPAWLRIISWVALGVMAGALLGYFFLPRSASNSVTLRTLTFSGTDLAPSVSPDGRTVAFQSNRDGASRI